MTNFSLYIHYPFCKTRCPYCGFATAVEKENQADRYVEALKRELTTQSARLPWLGGVVQTIFFGGGTPSLMGKEHFQSIIDLIYSTWTVSPDAEVTLESNPSQGEVERYAEFLNLGVNRISIGAQTFHDEELKSLGRSHDVADTINAFKFAREAGFNNISLDLIYGVPGQSILTFKHSVQQALDLGIDHLSTYALSIEPGTPFEKRVRRGKMPYPDPDLAADQYDVLCKMMGNAGFEHYELTNFAKPNMWSRHNFAYWERVPYLGVGCGAHSFDGLLKRLWNKRSTDEYIESVNITGDGLDDGEWLTPWDELEERLYLALRCRTGLNKVFVRPMTKPGAVEELLSFGLLEQRGDSYHVPENKWLMLDDIVLRLLPTTPEIDF